MQEMAEMNLESFEDELDRRGADLERWPADVRAGAEALLMRSEPARGLLEEARRLDALFDDVPRAEASAELRRRLAEIPIRYPRSEAAWQWPFESAWRPLLGLALAAAFGVVVGGVTPTEVADGSATEADEWDDVAGVILGSDVDAFEEGEET